MHHQLTDRVTYTKCVVVLDIVIILAFELWLSQPTADQRQLTKPLVAAIPNIVINKRLLLLQKDYGFYLVDESYVYLIYIILLPFLLLHLFLCHCFSSSNDKPNQFTVKKKNIFLFTVFYLKFFRNGLI